MAFKIKKKRAAAAEPTEESPGEAPVEVAPDQVLAVTQDSFGWIAENWKLLVGGLVALVVVLSAVSIARTSSAAKRAEDAVPALRAIATTVASVGEADGAYATPEARRDAILAATSGLELPALSGLAGAAKLAAGDAPGAVAALQTYQAAFADGPESLAGAFGLAAAQAEAGQLDAALATLDAVGTRSPGLGAVAAVQGARLVDAFAPPQQALQAYRDVVAAHPAAPGLPAVQHRITQLEIELGEDPAPAPEPAEGEAPSDGSAGGE